MRCAKVDRWVERFVDAVLDATRAQQIEEHVQSCTRCSARVAAARALKDAFEAPTRAPPGFASRVMEAVHREALVADMRSASRNQEGPSSRLPYRRLGLTLVLTAGVLAASLFVPHAAYTGLLGTVSAAGLSPQSSTAVHSVLIGADSIVRGILREQANGGNVR